MKSRIALVCLLMLALPAAVFASSSEPVYEPTGMWTFSAPDAPYGYTDGMLEVKKVDDGYSVFLSFTGIEYRFECSRVVYKDEKLSFSLYLEGEDILLSFQFEDVDNMYGKAVYSEGAIPLTAKRKKE